MKKILLKTLCLLLLAPFAFTGCASRIYADQGKSDIDAKTQDSVIDPDDLPEPLLDLSVVDQYGKSIAKVRASDIGMITPYGMFYKVNNEYHLLRTENNNNEDVTLAAFDDISYETEYARTILGGKLYTLAVSGDLMGSDPFTQWLLEFDLKNGTAERYKISENGFPYSSLTSIGDKIILFFHDQKDVLNDRIIEFDPATGKTSDIMTYYLDNNLKGDSVRSLCSDKDNLYILRIKFNGNTDISMYIDVFDKEYKKVRELDITDIAKEGAAQCISTEDPGELANEFSQHISGFRIIDGKYLYYQNFSVSRFILDLEKGSVLYSIPEPFMCAPGDGELMFYTIMSIEELKTIDPYAVYRFDKGTLKKDPTITVNDGQIIVSATSSSDGKYMVTVADQDQKDYTNIIYVN